MESFDRNFANIASRIQDSSIEIAISKSMELVNSRIASSVDSIAAMNVGIDVSIMESVNRSLTSASQIVARSGGINTSKIMELANGSFASAAQIEAISGGINASKIMELANGSFASAAQIEAISGGMNASKIMESVNRSLASTSHYFKDAISRSAKTEQLIFSHELFVKNLFQKVRERDCNNLVQIHSPTPEEIEEFDIDRYDLGENEKSALLSVEKCPLKLIAKIMNSPSDMRNLTARQFEEFIAETISQLGFSDVVLTPSSRDGGKDIIASHQINGIPLSFYFECKRYAKGNKIQLETLRTLLGTMAHNAGKVNKGVLVTTSTFTKGCQKFILAESRLDGKDYDGILGWINELKNKM